MGLFIIMVFSFFYSIPSFLSWKMCSGVLCDDNCQNCYQCNTSNCRIEKNCFCGSKNIPGNLNIETTPQFLFFTLDDSVKTEQLLILQNFDFLLKNPKIKDANGCPPKISSYILSSDMDYNVVKWEATVGSASLHTVTHTTSFSTDLSTWMAELSNNYNAIKLLGNVTNIYGSRAPYLEPNDDYFQALTELGILYDSSYFYQAIYYNQNNVLQQKNFWPFTLDFGFPDPMICQGESCLNIPRPGIWEFIMADFIDSNGNPIDSMNYPITALEDIKRDFNFSFFQNRAPRGFYLHYNYFTVGLEWAELDANVVNFVVGFYSWVTATYPGQFLFATEKDVIDWMKNPQPLSVTKTMPQFQCRDNSKTPSTICPYLTCGFPEGNIKVCSNDCPMKYPDIYGDWKNSASNGTSSNGTNSSSNQTNSSSNGINNWLASGVILRIDSNWTTGVCGTILVTNPNVKLAAAYVLTMNLCGGTVSSTWGTSSSVLIQKTNKDQLWRFEVNVQIQPGGSDSTIGFCASIQTAFSAFLAVDLYQNLLSCTALNCPVYCGDGVCSGSESIGNCPFDCSPKVCLGGSTNSSSNGTNSSSNGTNSSSNGTNSSSNGTNSSSNGTNSSSNGTNSSSNGTNSSNGTSNGSNGTNGSSATVWPGVATFSVYEDWGTGFCAYLYIKNPNPIPAISFILTIEICNIHGTISSLWGQTQGALPVIGTKSKYRMIPIGNVFVTGVPVNVGAFCMAYNRNFIISSDIRLGLDLMSIALTSTLTSAIAVCGDDICSTNERSSTLCAIDCNPIAC